MEWCTAGIGAGVTAGERRRSKRERPRPLGGRSCFRGMGLERLFRDVQGARKHPLPERIQQRFTGRLELGRDPAWTSSRPRSNEVGGAVRS